tara:strand:- start:2122 stop:3249 length:1128 start_codon:yes stop_codon:yes gene_type:complete
MAILTGITGAVRANIAGAAQRTVKNVASGVKSIAGLDNIGSNSQLGQLSNLMGGSSSNILSYPLAVDTDPQQGHYVLFHINTRKNGKLVTPKSGKNMSEAVKKMERERGAPPPPIGPPLYDGPKVPKIESAKGNKNRSIVLSKLPTKRLEKSIALYMPPNVQVNYEVKYADEEIGALAMAGSAVIDKIKGNASTESVLRTALDGAEVKEGLTDFFNKALDTVASGAEALSQLERGSVITPRMEMMFEGVGRRSFSYTFAFIPKSEQEALVVEDIIQHFKFYAMPKYSNSTTRREMDIPGTFDIEYMYRGSRNNFLNRVHTCFLTQVQVQYGADRYTAYEETTGGRGKGSPPQKSQITLNFTELEVLSQDHIDEGY